MKSVKIKNKLIKDLLPFIKAKYPEKYESILMHTYIRFNELCEENINDSKAVKAHTVEKIFPCIAIFDSLLDERISREEASTFIDVSYCKLAEKEAKMLQNLMKIPGAYKIMPKMFTSTLKKAFGTDAGFKYKVYDTPKTRSKFDMLSCPYVTYCKKYNAPEITKSFCHSDDVKDAHIHKKLIWNRKKTMGEGDELCDFDLYIKENEDNK